MSDIKIFIPDKDNEGEWRDIDEELLDLSSHDAKVRADGYNNAIDDFIHECDKYCGFYNGKNKNLTREDMLNIAERLKGKMNNEFI